MSYTLEQFAADCRAALKADAGAGGQERVRQCVQRALKDESFLASRLGPEATKERDIIYQDAELGFCICAHVNAGAKQGSPHDHGSTWAIYGQAEGTTKMTDWRLVTPPNGDEPGQVEISKTYQLNPGDAHIYNVGDIHAPYRDGPTRLIRIEGVNTDGMQRTPVKAIE